MAPAHGDGSSTVAFAVVTSTSVWFSSTRSPSATSHARPRRPPVPRRGRGAGSPGWSSVPDHAIDRRPYALGGRNVMALIVAGGYGMSRPSRGRWAPPGGRSTPPPAGPRLRADAERQRRLVDDHGPAGPAPEAASVSTSSGTNDRRSTTSTCGPPPRRPAAAASAPGDHGTPREDRAVEPARNHARAAERGASPPFSSPVLLRPVPRLRLQEHHRVGIGDRPTQHCVCVQRRGGGHHLQPGGMCVVGLGRVRMVLRALIAPPNGMRMTIGMPTRSTGSIAVLRDVADHLVQGRIGERVELHLHHRLPAWPWPGRPRRRRSPTRRAGCRRRALRRTPAAARP